VAGIAGVGHCVFVETDRAVGLADKGAELLEIARIALGTLFVGFIIANCASFMAVDTGHGIIVLNLPNDTGGDAVVDIKVQRWVDTHGAVKVCRPIAKEAVSMAGSTCIGSSIIVETLPTCGNTLIVCCI
jgi:hypothetical protein